MSEIQVAFSQDFLEAYANLPQKAQKKLSETVTKFRNNPTSSGLNFEKINDAAEKGMRSIRIDDNYRGILLKPDSGNVYILLWADNHDAAYDWARRHRCRINTTTGALQIYESTYVAAEKQAPPQEAASDAIPGVFDALKERELLRLGVPEEHIQLVRKMADEDDLDAAQRQLPREAYEGLFLYLAGSSYEQVINEREAPQEITDSDFEQALQRLDTRSHIVVPEDDKALHKMLSAPLEQWRVFLYPTQRRLAINDKSGAVRVLGGAGTGKTVVAMHRARWLARYRPERHGRILFTTFTRNLATDIAQNLDSICSPEEKSRIDVINLDAWVRRYLASANYPFQAVYPDTRDTDAIWAEAMNRKPADIDLTQRFFQDEWQRVIQPQGIETIDGYKRASRVGRGQRLSRRQRMAIWPVFEEYRNGLIRRNKKEIDDAYHDAAALIRQSEQNPPYQSVIVDEAQDMGPQAFRLLRALVPEGQNDLFIVGDGHQRIYGRNKVVLSHCDINIVGRSHKLKINYRTTDEIRKWAVNILRGTPVDDLDGGQDDNKGFKSLTHGDAPSHEAFADELEQNEFVAEYLSRKRDEGYPLSRICIAARTARSLDTLEKRLADDSIEFQRIKKDAVDAGENSAVRLATMHRVKGLEFEEIIILGANEGLLPLKQALEECNDLTEKKRVEQEERALLYVCATRAKYRAVVLSYGEASRFLK